MVIVDRDLGCQRSNAAYIGSYCCRDVHQPNVWLSHIDESVAIICAYACANKQDGQSQRSLSVMVVSHGNGLDLVMDWLDSTATTPFAARAKRCPVTRTRQYYSLASQWDGIYGFGPSLGCQALDAFKQRAMHRINLDLSLCAAVTGAIGYATTEVPGDDPFERSSRDWVCGSENTSRGAADMASWRPLQRPGHHEACCKRDITCEAQKSSRWCLLCLFCQGRLVKLICSLRACVPAKWISKDPPSPEVVLIELNSI